MNKRVYNALRKIAAEPRPEQWDEGESFNYYMALPYRDTRAPKSLGANHAKRTLVRGDNKYPTMEQIRQLQARLNAADIAPFGTDKYFDIRKHLLNYGRTKQYNNTNPDNPKPMPIYSGNKLTEAERETLSGLENIQANNSRRNQYSDVG